jgi:oxaloacetate decarboxylase alpha subunit/pyruvate carboxylase subunit B
MMNVKFGRWKTIAPAAADIALNKYGRPPGVVDPELLKLIKERTGQTPIEGRPADALAPRMGKLREELAAKKLPTDDEACVLHAMFPQEFAKLHAPKPATPPAPVEVAAKPAATPAPAPAAAPAKPAGPGTRYRLTIAGQTTEATVEEV